MAFTPSGAIYARRASPKTARALWHIILRPACFALCPATQDARAKRPPKGRKLRLLCQYITSRLLCPKGTSRAARRGGIYCVLLRSPKGRKTNIKRPGGGCTFRCFLSVPKGERSPFGTLYYVPFCRRLYMPKGPSLSEGPKGAKGPSLSLGTERNRNSEGPLGI